MQKARALCARPTPPNFSGQEPVADVKTVLTFFRRGLTALAREAKRDDGVLALVIAIALIAAAAALIATTARQNKEAEVARMSGNAKNVKLLKNSIVAYFLTDADGSGAGTANNSRIICPDASFPPDGIADGTTTCTSNTGVVPWVSLGLSQNDVIDAYGNYFTYAVSGSDTSRQVCESFTSDLDTSQNQYPGTMYDVTDTEVRLSSQSAGQGTPYYYAFISHGPNGLGAISQSGTRRSAPSSSAEVQNCPATNTNCSDSSPLVLFSGPVSTDQSSYFDDQVYVGSNEQLTELCETLSPGGGPNADTSTSFSNDAVGSVPTSLAGASSGVSVQNSSRTGNGNNRVLRFDGSVNGATIRTNVATYNTAESPKYVSFQWAPITGTTAGISLATRATTTDRQTGITLGAYTADLFSPDGLTFRFYEDSGASNISSSSLNRIYICDQTSVAGTNCRNGGTFLAQSTSTFSIELDHAYTIEVYDDGNLVWARITEVGDTSNTATVTLNTSAAQQDLSGFNAISFINFTNGVTELDDLSVARASMAAAFDGTGIVETTNSANAPNATPSITLEAWIRPTAMPASSALATIISKWQDSATTDSNQAYRLYMGSDGGLTLQMAGGSAGTVSSIHRLPGYSARVGRWDHIAVVYSFDEQSVKLYVNREFSSRTSATAFDTTGINAGTRNFSIGGERNASAIVNAFTGDITDVRVWNTARTAQQIFANYNRRIPLTGTLTGLVLNWTLDRDTTTTFSSPSAAPTSASTAASATGTFQTGATAIGIHQRHFPVFSTAFCGSGVKLTPYQCEFRSTAQSRTLSVPNNLASIFVKAWGGGGGGYSFANGSSGGGGGFSGGRVTTINSVAIAGASGLRVDVGGGASASASANNGTGGGGASGFWRDADESSTVSTGDRPGIVAGGGGGAAYGDDSFISQVASFNCDAAGDCGPGGGGGGPYNIAGLTGVQTTRAPDDNENICGGRGGDSASFGNSPPDPAPGSGGTNTCDSGGGDPTSTTGATGSGSNVGGTSILGAGGAGYNGGTNRVGGAGGGGGVSNTAMTAGGGEAGGADSGGGTNNGADGNRAGFGGGGGAGFADSTVLNATGASGTATATTSTAGGTADAEYCAPVSSFGIGSDGATRPAYLATGCTTTFPARGGQPGDTTGHAGAVVIKW